MQSLTYNNTHWVLNASHPVAKGPNSNYAGLNIPLSAGTWEISVQAHISTASTSGPGFRIEFGFLISGTTSPIKQVLGEREADKEFSEIGHFTRIVYVEEPVTLTFITSVAADAPDLELKAGRTPTFMKCQRIIRESITL